MALRSLTDIQTQCVRNHDIDRIRLQKIKTDQAADLAGCMDTFVSGMANQKTRSAIAAIAARVTKSGSITRPLTATFRTIDNSAAAHPLQTYALVRREAVYTHPSAPQCGIHSRHAGLVEKGWDQEQIGDPKQLVAGDQHLLYLGRSWD
jgi:hypothetical protein